MYNGGTIRIPENISNAILESYMKNAGGQYNIPGVLETMKEIVLSGKIPVIATKSENFSITITPTSGEIETGGNHVYYLNIRIAPFVSDEVTIVAGVQTNLKDTLSVIMT